MHQEKESCKNLEDIQSKEGGVGRVTLAPFAHYIAVKRKSVTQKDASNSRRPPFCVLFDYILSSFVGFQLREEAERHAAP